MWTILSIISEIFLCFLEGRRRVFDRMHVRTMGDVFVVVRWFDLASCRFSWYISAVYEVSYMP